MRANGADTFYYNRPYFEYIDSGDCQLNAYALNWISSVKKSSGDFYLESDTSTYRIKPIAAVGDVWSYSTTGANAQVIAILEEIVLGVLDSVKWIKISQTNYEDTIKLSKRHGFINAHNFRTGLEGELDLVGLNEVGITNLDAQKMFDFEIGDEISSEEGGILYPYVRRELFVVLDKDTQIDRINYQMRKCWLEYNKYNWQILDTGSDTIDVSIVFSTYFLANQLPHTSVVDNQKVYDIEQSSRGSYNGRMVKEIFVRGYLDSSGCFNWITDSIYPYGIEGLGFWYYFDASKSKDPIYYKKGNETWGTPMTCEDILSGLNDGYSSPMFAAYPNPANDVLIVKGKNLDQIEILDVMGKLILTKQAIGEPIDISTIPNGMYLVKATHRNGYAMQKLLIAR
ncbi:MAG: T9SS type A sorting domain-containing protein [Chitinophagales bacterium]|nr:T9SS type A sorting domain-containing protein [Chitinophagales bacterium]